MRLHRERLTSQRRVAPERGQNLVVRQRRAVTVPVAVDAVIGQRIRIAEDITHVAKGDALLAQRGEQKALGLSDEVLRTQIKIGLHGVRAEDAAKVWIAYEPVWAIGVNGVPATKEYAEEKHGVMRAALVELYGEEVGGRIPLLYGGSVNPENAPELIQRENIDGLFIGRSAWQADKFEAIIRTVLPLWREK